MMFAGEPVGDLHKRLQRVIDPVFGNTDAGVLHRNGEFPRVRQARTRCDLAAGMCKLDRVRHQVEQYLPERAAVGIYVGQTVRYLEFECQVSFVQLGFNEFGAPVHKLHRVDMPQFQLIASCFDLRQIQYVVNHAQKMLTAGQNV